MLVEIIPFYPLWGPPPGGSSGSHWNNALSMYTSRWKAESEAPNEEVTCEPPTPAPVLVAVVWSLVWLGKTWLPLNPALFSILNQACERYSKISLGTELPKSGCPRSYPQVCQTLHRIERMAWMASPGTISTQGNPEKSDQTHILPEALCLLKSQTRGWSQSQPAF